MRRVSILWSITFLLAGPFAAAAQPLGTFRWQLQPFCNIVTVVATQAGDVFQLDGIDDQCGGGDLASVIGTAFRNPDGSIGFGLTIVASPGGVPVHVEADVNLPALDGTWRDSAGRSGAFVFTPGAGTGGTPRPATGNIGGLAINPSEVQRRISGTCPADEFVRAINENGTVTCAAALAGGGRPGDITSVAAGFGLVGGGLSGDVTLAIPLTGSGAFDFSNKHGVTSAGTVGTGGLGLSGPGTRMLWYPGKAAFRAGTVAATQWDDANVGLASVASGDSTIASGPRSTATGGGSEAIAESSTAMGFGTLATGVASTSMGLLTVAGNTSSTAMGFNTVAGGTASLAAGTSSSAGGAAAMALGDAVHASGNGSVVLGSRANALPAAKGTFIFGDQSANDTIVGSNPNQFIARAAGGVAFFTNAERTAGVTLPPGGGAWAAVSDRNQKEHFRDLSGEDVLRKLARMPIQEWSYKAQAPSIRHVGPTAQDFHAAFGLGEDPLRISTIDADGIALAAIRALEARTAALIQENERLRARVEKLERR